MAVGINANDPWLFDLVTMEARDLAEDEVMYHLGYAAGEWEFDNLVSLDDGGWVLVLAHGRRAPGAESVPVMLEPL